MEPTGARHVRTCLADNKSPIWAKLDSAQRGLEQVYSVCTDVCGLPFHFPSKERARLPQRLPSWNRTLGGPWLGSRRPTATAIGSQASGRRDDWPPRNVGDAPLFAVPVPASYVRSCYPRGTTPRRTQQAWPRLRDASAASQTPPRDASPLRRRSLPRTAKKSRRRVNTS